MLPETLERPTTDPLLTTSLIAPVSARSSARPAPRTHSLADPRDVPRQASFERDSESPPATMRTSRFDAAPAALVPRLEALDDEDFLREE
jgi:hypothetical protein